MPHDEDDHSQDQETFSSRLEQEVRAILLHQLADHPLPDVPISADPVQQEHEGVYLLSSQAASALHCVAIVRNGKIIPIVDLEHIAEPVSAGEKMHLFALTARTILDGLMEALLFWEQRRRDAHRQDNDEGGSCHV